MSQSTTKDNNKKTLIDEWSKDQIKTINAIHEAINHPTRYIELKTRYTENDIKKTVIAIVEQLKKEKEIKSYDQSTITAAQRITRYFADLMRQKQENRSMLINNKNNEINARSEVQKATELNKEKCDKANPSGNNSNNKRKNDNDEETNIEINEDNLTEIVDLDNINPTKRKRIISKNYLKDDSEMPSGWHTIQNNEAKPFIKVRPKDTSDIDMTTFKNHVESTLDEEERDYGEIDSITKGNKVIMIHFEDIRNRDKFVKYIKDNRPEWEHIIPTLKNPCVRINGVTIIGTNSNASVDWEQWVKKILNKNKWIPQTQDSVFKVIFSVPKKGRWNVVIEVSPNIRQAIVKKQGRIFSGTSKYEVYDNFNIIACYNCSTYGHTTNQCGQQPVCNYCSKQHHTNCPVKEQPNKHKCPSCKKTGHAFNDPTCPEFIWRLHHELQFINMNYNIIMTPKK